MALVFVGCDDDSVELGPTSTTFNIVHVDPGCPSAVPLLLTNSNSSFIRDFTIGCELYRMTIHVLYYYWYMLPRMVHWGPGSHALVGPWQCDW